MITNMPNYGDIIEVEDEISGLSVNGTVVLVEEDDEMRGLYYAYLQSKEVKDNIHTDKNEPYFKIVVFTL